MNFPVPKALTSAMGKVSSALDGITGGASSSASVSGDPDLSHPNYTVIITQAQDAGGKGKPGTARVVVGSMPDTIELNQAVGWKAPWGAGIAGEGAVSDVLALTGNRLVAQVMTLKVWQGSTNDFDFTVQFQLRAWTDPELDVMEPLRNLLRMSLPSMNEAGFLTSPGPVLKEEAIKEGASTTAEILGDAAGSLMDLAKEAMKDTTSSLTAKVKNFKSGATDVLAATGITKKSFLESRMSNIISIQIGTWFSLHNVLIQDVRYTLNTQTPYGPTGQPTSADVTVSFTPMFAITQEDISTILKSPGG